MATLTNPTPVIRVARKELELVIHLTTDQHVEIREGDSYQLTIEGDEEQSGSVRVAFASFMSRGVTREWTLTLRFA